MESKVIEQIDYDNILLRTDGDILVVKQDFMNSIFVEATKLPDLIAALQSFLPKETE